jgi:hypothetical protein
VGNVSTRLLAFKQQALRRALSRVLGSDVSSELAIEVLGELYKEGLELKMLGGDVVWWTSEEPPTPAELRARAEGTA